MTKAKRKKPKAKSQKPKAKQPDNYNNNGRVIRNSVGKRQCEWENMARENDATCWRLDRTK